MKTWNITYLGARQVILGTVACVSIWSSEASAYCEPDWRNGYDSLGNPVRYLTCVNPRPGWTCIVRNANTSTAYCDEFCGDETACSDADQEESNNPNAVDRPMNVYNLKRDYDYSYIQRAGNCYNGAYSCDSDGNIIEGAQGAD